MSTPLATPRGGVGALGLSRRATMLTPGSGLAETNLQQLLQPLHAPEFLVQDAQAAFHLPATVTASGYVKGMPVAYDPVPTPRRRAQQQMPPPAAAEPEPSAAAAGRRGRTSDRRSTLPEHHALRDFVLPPPLLHSALTPSCERCAVDAEDEGDLSSGSSSSIVQPSQIYCLECEQYLCGNEAADDGMARPASSRKDDTKPSSASHAHRGCNLRMHRHSVMQGHVRVAASTAMQLNKLQAEEEASKPEEQRHSRKELILHLFRLPMKHIVWQYRSSNSSAAVNSSSSSSSHHSHHHHHHHHHHHDDVDDDDANDAYSAAWIEFDLLTQNKLEHAFGPSHTHADRSKQVAISEQYTVGYPSSSEDKHCSSSSTADAAAASLFFEMTNTRNKAHYVVRRLDMNRVPSSSLRDTFGSGSSDHHHHSHHSHHHHQPRPNSRPSSAAASPRNSAPPSPTSQSLNQRRGSWRRAVPAVPLLAPLATNATTTSNGHTATALHSASSSNGSVSHRSGHSGGTAGGGVHHLDSPSTSRTSSSVLATPRPGLGRHASMDAVQMQEFKNFLPAQWHSFARSQPAPHPPAAHAHGGDDAESSTKKKPDGSAAAAEEELFPLFDMERGNALLLSVYHNAPVGAVEVLLDKGFSARISVTTWTHLSALQLACMQGNDALAALLLDKGQADPAYYSRTGTPTMALEYAVKSGNLALVKRLLHIRTNTGARMSHSDIKLQEAKRRAKRSTWIDIADAGNEGAKGPTHAAAAAAASGGSSSSSTVEEDRDYQLYPHLLTEAINVPPIQAHTLDVVRFLLDRMLERAEKAAKRHAPAPKFELSRYHEMMSACVSSSSVERVRFLVRHWHHYTRLLQPLRTMSDVFEDHLRDERYARAVLDFQPSIDALFFQACTQHPASEEEEEEEEDAGGDRKSPASDGLDEDDEDTQLLRELTARDDGDNDASAAASSGSFEILRFLLDEAGADVNMVLRDASDGTELTPLLMSLRDRKPFLTAFLVARGADIERRQRCALVDLPPEADLEGMYPPVEREEEGMIADASADASDPARPRAWQLLLPLEFAADETSVAMDPDELATFRNAIEEGMRRRHQRANKLVRVVHGVSRIMAGLALEESGDDDDEDDGRSGGMNELMSPLPVPLSPTAPALSLSEPFNVHVLHVIVAFCCGSHALAIGADVSAATGMPLSRPPSPGI